MSTPATAALSDAATGGAAPNAGTAAPGAGGTATPAAPNPNAFWNSWNLPEQKETRDWVSNKNYENPFVLAKTAQQLEREAATLRAGKGYPVPGQDGKVDPNAQKAWNTLTGVPETPDKYDFKLPADPMPNAPGVTQKLLAEEFHRLGVPAAMAKQLGPALIDGVLGKLEAQTREIENAQSAAALKELERAWGSNYQERVALGKRGQEWLAKESGGLNDVQMRVLESVLGTDKFMTMMWKIGAGNGEASFAGDNLTGGRSFSGGASEAQAKLNQMTADRAAGRLTDAQWREFSQKGGDLEKLTNIIANGMAQQ
jgi:hypothetical protein